MFKKYMSPRTGATSDIIRSILALSPELPLSFYSQCTRLDFSVMYYICSHLHAAVTLSGNLMHASSPEFLFIFVACE